MFDYVQEALDLLDQTFAPPEYLGDLSRPRFTSRQAPDLFTKAYRALTHGQAAQGGDALSHFFLAVLYHHMEGQEDDFVFHMKAALEYDPDFLEAEIALRDRGAYLDPFSYPKWEDLRDGKADFRPSVLASCQPKGCRLDLVRQDSLTTPAVVIRYPRTSFRALPTENTAAKVLVNVEAVPPHMPALAQVVPVIFDDPDDPFFCTTYLNLFPVARDTAGTEQFRPADYQPWLGRDTARRLCRPPHRCCLFVLDEHAQLVLARLIEFDEPEAAHHSELDAVLAALDTDARDYRAWKAAAEMHNRVYCREIENPQGKLITRPKGRSLQEAGKWIHTLVAVDRRVHLAGVKEASDVSRYARTNDLFISHAHADSAWAEAVADWLESIWPQIEIFRTDPSDPDRFRRDPHYFIREMTRSRCVVFLTTPRSIDRPMVQAERGVAAFKPVITVLAGGTTLRDLKGAQSEDHFAHIDLEKVASTDEPAGWRRLAELISQELDLPLPKRIPRGPELDPALVREGGPPDPLAAFLQDYAEIVERSDQQTESDAEHLLELVEDGMAKLAEQRGERINLRAIRALGLPLRTRLISILSGVPDEQVLGKMLDYFPALVDERLLLELQLIIEHAEESGQGDEVLSTFQRLLGIVRQRVRLD